MNDQTEIVSMGNGEDTGGALTAITRAEVDVQIATAKRWPRSLTQFQRDVLSAVTLDAEVAESCIYYRPVGKKKNELTGQWEESYAEGPSIRMAEIVAASYGNIRAGSRTIEKTDRYVKAQGVCHDLEKNVYAAIETTESTVTKDGVPFSERMRVVVEKATNSKAYRDAIFKVVPRAFIKNAYEQAKKVAAGGSASIEQRRDKVRQWLGSIKMPEERVFAALGVKGWSDVGVEHMLIITGLKTAIKDGDISVQDAFPDNNPAKPKVNEGGFLPKEQKPFIPTESPPQEVAAEVRTPEPPSEPVKRRKASPEPPPGEKTDVPAEPPTTPNLYQQLRAILAENEIDLTTFFRVAEDNGWFSPDIGKIDDIPMIRVKLLIGTPEKLKAMLKALKGEA